MMPINTKFLYCTAVIVIDAFIHLFIYVNCIVKHTLPSVKFTKIWLNKSCQKRAKFYTKNNKMKMPGYRAYSLHPPLTLMLYPKFHLVELETFCRHTLSISLRPSGESWL